MLKKYFSIIITIFLIPVGLALVPQNLNKYRHCLHDVKDKYKFMVYKCNKRRSRTKKRFCKRSAKNLRLIENDKCRKRHLKRPGKPSKRPPPKPVRRPKTEKDNPWSSSYNGPSVIKFTASIPDTVGGSCHSGGARRIVMEPAGELGFNFRSFYVRQKMEPARKIKADGSYAGFGFATVKIISPFRCSLQRCRGGNWRNVDYTYFCRRSTRQKVQVYGGSRGDPRWVRAWSRSQIRRAVETGRYISATR